MEAMLPSTPDRLVISRPPGGDFLHAFIPASRGLPSNRVAKAARAKLLIPFHCGAVICATILFVFILPTSGSSQTPPTSSADSARGRTWRTIAPDLDLGEFLPEGSFLQAPLVMVRSSLAKTKLRLIRSAEFGLARAEVRSLCRLAHASACINASFFDESGHPLGLLISRGVVIQNMHQKGRTLTGVLQVTRFGLDVLSRSQFRSHNVLEAVQAGPRLAIDGVATSGLKNDSRTGRAAVCRDRDNRVILAASSAGLRGLTFEELQDALLHESVGCVNALNLDGGGSAQIFIAPRSSSSSDTAVAVAINGFDPVPVALGIFEE